MNDLFRLLILGTILNFNPGIAHADAIQQASAVPDFEVHQNTTESGTTLVLTPPPKHHFNDKAPMKVTVKNADNSSSSTKAFQVKVAKITGITFFSHQKYQANTAFEVMAFLCDDAKTFCIKKVKTGIFSATTESKSTTQAMSAIATGGGVMPVVQTKIRVKSDPKPAAKTDHASDRKSEGAPGKKNEGPNASPGGSPVGPTPLNPKKDVHGFWDNNPNAAIREARTKKLPLLIDFYGIWCPPCNQFNESVFPKAAFKKEATQFVLLKMDADREESWEMKSHYQVGRYPTLVVANVEREKGEEVDRIVGFLPVNALVKRMREVSALQAKPLEARIASVKVQYLGDLQKLIEVRIEQKNFSDALKWANEAIQLKPDDEYLQLVRLDVQGQLDSKILLSVDAQKLLKQVWENREKAVTDSLVRSAQILVGNAESLPAENKKWASDELDLLVKRVDSKTLSLASNGGASDLTIGDLAELKVNLAEVAPVDQARLKKEREFAIESYQKLLRVYDSKSRGLHLELAYYLWKNGQVKEAAQIFSDYIAQYPREFTFYFAGAKMYLETGDLLHARAYAEKAAEFSYGDNHLRSVERLMQVMIAQGERKEAIAVGEKALAQAKDPAGFQVRSDRYLKAVRNALAKAESLAASSKK